MNKSLSFLLLFSIAGNAALGLALLSQKPEPTSATQNAAASLAVTTDSNQTPTVALNQAASAQSSDKIWARLFSSDQAALIANLRNAGFSPKLIRTIVQSLVYEKYASRLMAAQGLDKDTPYWKFSEVFYSGSKRFQEMNRVNQEMDKEIRSLLGPDYSTIDESSLPYVQRQYGNIPGDKLVKLVNIQRDYREMMSDLQSGGTLLPADREKLKLIEKEQRADIEKLLTTDELFEYDLRNSPASWRLKGWDQVFDLTEAEYRTLFPLYQKLEQQVPSDSGVIDMNARRAAEEKIQDQIKAALGDARYAEYKQSRDQSAQQENRLVLRLGLPLTVATQLVDTKKEFRNLAKALQKNNEMTDEQKKEQLLTLAQNTEARVSTLIGEQGLKAYREYGGGWLKPAN